MSDLIRRADALALFAENDNIPTEIVRASIENLPAVQLDALAAISRMGAGDGLIKRATAALEGVTGGPWRVDGEPWNQIVWSGAENRVCFMAHSNGLDDDRDIATARFIAFTRQWVPEAAARIAALTAQNREMALDVLASSGQAQEACAAQLAAEAERDALRAVQPDTREAALRDIARQKKTDEMDTEYDVEYADFEGGYNAIIDVARVALPAVQPDRERIAFSMWKAEADRAAPNVGKHRSPSGFMAVSEQERDRWLGLADAVIAALRGEAEPNEYERKVAQMKEDFPNGI